MNQPQANAQFSAGDPAPNPFLGTDNGLDPAAMPTIPGFDLSAAKKSPINIHGVLTLAILAIAAVAIWGMRTIGLKGLQGTAVGADQGAISIDPAARPAVMTVEDQRLLTDLNSSRTVNQVPGDELQKNPFALSAAARPRSRTNINAPASASGPTQEELAAARQQELLAALSDFKLQGVMGGKGAVARINGKAYRVGDTLGEAKPGDKAALPFVVTAIDGREVTVSYEGFNFILSMDAQ